MGTSPSGTTVQAEVVRARTKHASGGQGMIPWTPGCECSRPSFLGSITFADGLCPSPRQGMPQIDTFVSLHRVA